MGQLGQLVFGLYYAPVLTVPRQDPWWVIALKVAAYLIGLLLAGIGTAQAAVTLM